MVGLDALTYVGNHGLERLDPGADGPVARPGDRAARRARPAVCRPSVSRRSWSSSGSRSRTRTRSGPSTTAGPPTRTRPVRRWSGWRRARTPPGLDPHWGRKVLEIRPTALGRQGHRGGRRARRRRPRAGVVRRRRHHRRGRIPAAARAARRRDARGCGLRRRRVAESPAAVVDEADLVVEGTDGFLEMLECLAA